MHVIACALLSTPNLLRTLGDRAAIAWVVDTVRATRAVDKLYILVDGNTPTQRCGLPDDVEFLPSSALVQPRDAIAVSLNLGAVFLKPKTVECAVAAVRDGNASSAYTVRKVAGALDAKGVYKPGPIYVQTPACTVSAPAGSGAAGVAQVELDDEELIDVSTPFGWSCARALVSTGFK